MRFTLGPDGRSSAAPRRAARDHLATLTTHRELLLARRELVKAQAVNQGGGALDLAPFRDRAAEAEAKEAQAAAR